MFNVTLVNLAADARSAAADLGSSDLGILPAAELIALLETFRELDPLQNVEADPQIVVASRRQKFLIRTGQKSLVLYDVRNAAEPARKLTAAEIIAELDGSAEAARTAPPFATLTPVEEPTVPVETVAVPDVPSTKLRLAMAAVATVLLAYVLYLAFGTNEGNLPASFSRITESAELAAQHTALVGVYMTGSEPGQHGIVVLADGSLKLFQVNAQVAPSMIYATYRLGRLGETLCLATNQPGGLIAVIDRDTLVYCGETYKRIP